MVESETRRRLLRGLAAGGGIALFGGLLFGDDAIQAYREWQCPQRRDPTWEYDPSNVMTLFPGIPVFTGSLAYVPLGHGVTTGDDDGIPLVAIDPRTGSERWRFTPEGDGTGRPLVTDEQLYVGTGSDTVAAFDRATKERLWTYDAGGNEGYGGGAWGRPALVDDTLVIGISHSELDDPDPSDPSQYTSRILGLDPATGSLRWEQMTDTEVFAGPTAVGGDVVAVTKSGVVYRLSANDGSVQWRAETGATARVPPRVRNETVYVGGDSRVVALSLESGRRTWTVTLDSEHATRLQFVDETIVVGDDSGTVSGISLDGTIRWRLAERNPISGLCAVESTVYALAHTGRLLAVDATDGTLIDEWLLVERRSDEGCGWFPGTRSVLGLATDGEALYPLTRRWVRRYSFP